MSDKTPDAITPPPGALQNAPARRVRRAAAQRGLGLAELLIALAISATLLTATMFAIDASFTAYAASVEQSSAHSASRMVMHRLMAMVRTSTAHGPLLPDAAATPPVTLDGVTLTSNFIELVTAEGDFVRVEHRVADQELWIEIDPADGSTPIVQPLIEGVTNATFRLDRRLDQQGLWTLERFTLDLTVEPGEDATLAIESGAGQAVRLVASTMPRQLEDE